MPAKLQSNGAMISFRGPPPASVKVFDSSFQVNLGDAVAVTVDPMNTREVRMEGKVVGYVDSMYNEGDKLMAKITITDQAVRDAIMKPCHVANLSVSSATLPKTSGRTTRSRTINT